MISSGMHEYMKVRQYIVDMCHHTDSDHALPSERQISELFHVSRSTVRRALSDLVNAHYLLKCPKRGYFVNSSRSGRFQGKIIGVVSYDSMHVFIANSDLLAFSSLYSEAQRYPVAIQNILCPSPEKLADDIQKGALDGVLWYSVPDSLMDCYEELVRSGIPMVAIFQGEREPETEGDYLYLDHRRETYAQTRYLLEHGAKRILFPQLEETSYIEAYRMACRDAGVKLEEEWIYPENSFADMLPELYERWKFDGVICRYGCFHETMDFARKRGIAIPEELQVVTGISLWSDSATQTRKPFQKMFRLCLRQLWGRMNGKRLEPMHINSLEWSVIPGTTTRKD